MPRYMGSFDEISGNMDVLLVLGPGLAAAAAKAEGQTRGPGGMRWGGPGSRAPPA